MASIKEGGKSFFIDEILKNIEEAKEDDNITNINTATLNLLNYPYNKNQQISPGGIGENGINNMSSGLAGRCNPDGKPNPLAVPTPLRGHQNNIYYQYYCYKRYKDSLPSSLNHNDLVLKNSRFFSSMHMRRRENNSSHDSFLSPNGIEPGEDSIGIHRPFKCSFTQPIEYIASSNDTGDIDEDVNCESGKYLKSFFNHYGIGFTDRSLSSLEVYVILDFFG